MSKALKALSIFAALCAVASVVFVVVLGIQDDQQIEKFINAAGAIEQFRTGVKTTDETTDKVSPLLKHARAFGLRINPPPPPKPKKPKAPSKPQVAKKTTPDRPKPKAPVSAKFKLLATCRYEQQPARSLALLDMPVKGIKWYRQGDDVGHLKIQEVKDGSVVCSDGQELFVPVSSKKTKTLLKSEVAALQRPQATISTPLEVVESVIDEEEPAAPETLPTIAGVQPEDSHPVGASPAKPREDSTRRRRVRRLPPRKPRQLPPAEPTPEERREVLTESIATIREMMDNPASSLTDEEKAAEMKIWEQMLESLEQEQAEIEDNAATEKNEELGGPKK
jgi:hypothetical protein